MNELTSFGPMAGVGGPETFRGGRGGKEPSLRGESGATGFVPCTICEGFIDVASGGGAFDVVRCLTSVGRGARVGSEWVTSRVREDARKTFSDSIPTPQVRSSQDGDSFESFYD